MLVGLYNSKDELQHAIGQPLHYQDAGLMVRGYTPFGTFVVQGPPSSEGPRWMAEVTVIDGWIVRVE